MGSGWSQFSHWNLRMPFSFASTNFIGLRQVGHVGDADLTLGMMLTFGLGGSTTLSVTGRCRDGLGDEASMEPLRMASQLSSQIQSRRLAKFNLGHWLPPIRTEPPG